MQSQVSPMTKLPPAESPIRYTLAGVIPKCITPYLIIQLQAYQISSSPSGKGFSGATQYSKEKIGIPVYFVIRHKYERCILESELMKAPPFICIMIQSTQGTPDLLELHGGEEFQKKNPTSRYFKQILIKGSIAPFNPSFSV